MVEINVVWLWLSTVLTPQDPGPTSGQLALKPYNQLFMNFPQVYINFAAESKRIIEDMC